MLVWGYILRPSLNSNMQHRLENHIAEIGFCSVMIDLHIFYNDLDGINSEESMQFQSLDEI